MNGGAVGAGIQVDFSRYMNSIIEVAADGSSARVQPGVVLAALNRRLQPLGVFFPPDPSSENHCSLGGMVGTNASGARTLKYGATKDHVLSLDVVMADGGLFDARPLTLGRPEMGASVHQSGLAGKAFASVLEDIGAARARIRASLPQVVKNSCGYRVETLLEDIALGEPLPVQKLFIGAEGTLGLVTEATLALTPLPPERGLAMAYFPSVSASGEAVSGILALGPSAVEIMDSHYLALVRQHDPQLDAMLPERTDTALLIEVEGCGKDEIDEKMAALRRHLAGASVLRFVPAMTADETAHLWQVRKSAVALMQRRPGARQPLPFIEDIAVHPRRLTECMDFLRKLFDRHDTQAVIVGHVGDGNLHTRPVLDPRDPADRRVMQVLYEEVSRYVLGVGGTLSGEHGDGLLHTPHLKAMYGSDVYELFTRIKRAFDPLGIMNPGKKVGPQDDGFALPEESRYGRSYQTLPQSPELHFPTRGYESEIERCHGCGVCKSGPATTMCPIYKATSREHASPRAKANLLRALITGALDLEDRDTRAVARSVIGYCIECGMCAVECPSAVNIPKLMLDAKGRLRQLRRGLPAPVNVILGHAGKISSLGSAVAPLSNAVARSAVVRGLAQSLLGLDARRIPPSFARAGRGRRGSRSTAPAPPGAPTVAHFCDLFGTYHDPELMRTVERVLAAHGVHVVRPRQKPSGVPQMLYGYANRARATAAYNVRAALPLVERGAVVVSAEPTAIFAFKVHYPDYLGTPEASTVAAAAYDLGHFLLRCRLDHPDLAPVVRPLQHAATLSGRPLRVGYHQPCHLKVQEVGNPGLQLLRELPELEIIDLDAGCCGMAGTFGMKASAYDLSLAAGAPLFERVSEVAPDLLASECSTCRMQLTHVLGIEAVHPITLLASAYGVCRRPAQLGAGRPRSSCCPHPSGPSSASPGSSLCE